VLDVNGDGRNDPLTSAAHDYGILDGAAAKPTMDEARDRRYLVTGACMTMVDLNGDGRQDFLTGKRYIAQVHDPGSRERWAFTGMSF
jgi:hypothetical protein